jgi:hypothetical protein
VNPSASDSHLENQKDEFKKVDLKKMSSHDVSVAGVNMRLKTSHDKEALTEILDLVNKRVDQEIAKVAPQKALVLACLRLAEDLHIFRQNTSQELNHIENLANRILADLQVSHL